jgi:hypothetical protein
VGQLNLALDLLCVHLCAELVAECEALPIENDFWRFYLGC